MGFVVAKEDGLRMADSGECVPAVLKKDLYHSLNESQRALR